MILYYGKIDKNIKVAKCNDMKFLIALGKKDDIYSTDCNDWFVEKSKENNYNVELLIHPNGVYGFDFINRDSDTKKIIDKTLDFIKNTNYKFV